MKGDKFMKKEKNTCKCQEVCLEDCLFEEIEFLKNDLLETKDLAISTLLQLVRYLQEDKEIENN